MVTTSEAWEFIERCEHCLVTAARALSTSAGSGLVAWTSPSELSSATRLPLSCVEAMPPAMRAERVDGARWRDAPSARAPDRRAVQPGAP